MFFIFGISAKEKDIDFSQTIICPSCEAYGRLEVFMTYSYFSLFFIPLIKWSKKYYARSTCCNSLYTIEDELGKDIEKGRVNKIDEKDLKPVSNGYDQINSCRTCNYPINKDFQYCPKCGRRV